MLGPLDVQVLVNRTLEVQKLQGNVLHQQEDESEVQKNRLDNQIRKEEQQVRRKNEAVHGRIQDEEHKQQTSSRQEKGRRFNGEKKEEERPPANRRELKGRFIDLEV